MEGLFFKRGRVAISSIDILYRLENSRFVPLGRTFCHASWLIFVSNAIALIATKEMVRAIQNNPIPKRFLHDEF